MVSAMLLCNLIASPVLAADAAPGEALQADTTTQAEAPAPAPEALSEEQPAADPAAAPTPAPKQTPAPTEEPAAQSLDAGNIMEGAGEVSNANQVYLEDPSHNSFILSATAGADLTADDYVYDKTVIPHILTIKSSKPITLSNSEFAANLNYRIVVESGIQADITLDRAKCVIDSENEAMLEVQRDATLTLRLAHTGRFSNRLSNEADNGQVINLASGASLIIDSKNGESTDGSLTLHNFDNSTVIEAAGSEGITIKNGILMVWRTALNGGTLAIGEKGTLINDGGGSFTIGKDATIRNAGTIINRGTTTNNGTVECLDGSKFNNETLMDYDGVYTDNGKTISATTSMETVVQDTSGQPAKSFYSGSTMQVQMVLKNDAFTAETPMENVSFKVNDKIITPTNTITWTKGEGQLTSTATFTLNTSNETFKIGENKLMIAYGTVMTEGVDGSSFNPNYASASCTFTVQNRPPVVIVPPTAQPEEAGLAIWATDTTKTLRPGTDYLLDKPGDYYRLTLYAGREPATISTASYGKATNTQIVFEKGSLPPVDGKYTVRLTLDAFQNAVTSSSVDKAFWVKDGVDGLVGVAASNASSLALAPAATENGGTCSGNGFYVGVNAGVICSRTSPAGTASEAKATLTIGGDTSTAIKGGTGSAFTFDNVILSTASQSIELAGDATFNNTTFTTADFTAGLVSAKDSTFTATGNVNISKNIADALTVDNSKFIARDIISNGGIAFTNGSEGEAGSIAFSYGEDAKEGLHVRDMSVENSQVNVAGDIKAGQLDVSNGGAVYAENFVLEQPEAGYAANFDNATVTASGNFTSTGGVSVANSGVIRAQNLTVVGTGPQAAVLKGSSGSTIEVGGQTTADLIELSGKTKLTTNAAEFNKNEEDRNWDESVILNSLRDAGMSAYEHFVAYANTEISNNSTVEAKSMTVSSGDKERPAVLEVNDARVKVDGTLGFDRSVWTLAEMEARGVDRLGSKDSDWLQAHKSQLDVSGSINAGDSTISVSDNTTITAKNVTAARFTTDQSVVNIDGTLDVKDVTVKNKSDISIQKIREDLDATFKSEYSMARIKEGLTEVSTENVKNSILYAGETGNVYGTFTIWKDSVVAAGETLNVGAGASVGVPKGTMFTVNKDGRLILSLLNAPASAPARSAAAAAPGKLILDGGAIVNTGTISLKDGAALEQRSGSFTNQGTIQSSFAMAVGFTDTLGQPVTKAGAGAALRAKIVVTNNGTATPAAPKASDFSFTVGGKAWTPDAKGISIRQSADGKTLTARISFTVGAPFVNGDNLFAATLQSKDYAISGGATTLTVEGAAPAQDAVSEFVTRLYDVCMERDPSASELAYWVDLFKNKGTTGTAAAQTFILGQEFSGKNYCNTDYVKRLYRAFMGREGEKKGLDAWIARLAEGGTREEVFNGFACSTEFGKLCKAAGIPQGEAIPIPKYGTVPHGPCPIEGTPAGGSAFIARLYTTCLGREGSANEIQKWAVQLWDHTKSGRDAAFGFIFSDEFTAKKTSDADFIKCLYRAFLNRQPDPTGVTTWMGKLAAGKTRLEVFEGFVGSDEFTEICQVYGIVRG